MNTTTPTRTITPNQAAVLTRAVEAEAAYWRRTHAAALDIPTRRAAWRWATACDELRDVLSDTFTDLPWRPRDSGEPAPM